MTRHLTQAPISRRSLAPRRASTPRTRRRRPWKRITGPAPRSATRWRLRRRRPRMMVHLGSALGSRVCPASGTTRAAWCLPHQAGHGAAATPLCSAPGGAAVVSRQGCLTRGLPTISCRGVTQGRKNPVERPLRPPGSRGHQGHPPPKPAQQAASPDRPRHGSGSGREPHPPLNARASCSGSRPRTVAVSPAVPPQTWPGREPPGNRLKTLGVPYGIRTRVTNVKGWCPGPLDERDGAARW